MAKLPDASSPLPTPFAQRPIVGYDGAAVGRSLTGVGQDLQASGQKAYDKQTRFEYERAKSHLLIAGIEAENELNNDNDFATYEQRYTEKMNKARAEAGALVTDPMMAQMFDLDSEEMQARGTQGVLARKKVKEKDFGKATLIDQLTVNRNKAIEARDPETRMALIDASNGLIQGAYDRDYIGAEEAVKTRNEYPQQFARDWAGTQDAETLQKLLTSTTLKPDAKMGKLYQVESKGDPQAKNPASSAAGLAQFTKGTAKQYGLIDRYDAVQSDAKAKQLWADNEAAMKYELGRDVSDGEIYLAHQQGAGGATALLKDPERLAVDVVGREEVLKNLPKSRADEVDTIKAGDFSKIWTDAYDKAEPVTEIQAFKKTGTPLDFLPYDEKLELVKKLPAMMKGEKDARENAVLDKLLPIVQGNNGDWTKIPQDLQDQAKALGLWGKVTEYKGSSDPDYLVELNNLSPEKLSDIDFNNPEVKLKLSGGDREKYAAKANEFRNKPEAETFLRTRTQMVDDAFESAKIDLKSDKGKQMRANLEMVLDASSDAYREQFKKYPDRQQVEQTISSMFLTKTFDTSSWLAPSVKHPFEYSLNDISDSERTQIISALKETGQPITGGNILRWYIKGKQRVE